MRRKQLAISINVQLNIVEKALDFEGIMLNT